MAAKESGKHADKKLHPRGGSTGKRLCLACERGGKTVAMPVADTTMYTLSHAIHNTVEIGATIHTDEWRAYGQLDMITNTRRSIIVTASACATA